MIDEKELISHIEKQYKEWGEEYDAGQILGDIEDFPKINEWIPFKLDEDGILEFPLPEEDQEILISDGYDVWMDTFLKDGEDCYLDSNIELIGLYWMPLPEPYKKEV